MSELEEDAGMTEREALNAMVVTLLQMRDWLAVIARSQSPDAARKVEIVHSNKSLVLNLPEYEYDTEVTEK